MTKEKKRAKVYYADLWGLKEQKYHYLSEHDVQTTEWQELKLKEPYYFFIPKDFGEEQRYQEFWSLKDIFERSSSSIKTHRDHFVVGFTPEEIAQRMRIFAGNLADEVVAQSLKLKDTRGWKLSTARRVMKGSDWKQYLKPYLYRPFDVRYCCYNSALIDRDRWDVMSNFLHDNLGLVSCRGPHEPKKRQFFVTINVTDKRAIADYATEAHVFPLYLYPSTSKEDLFDERKEVGERSPNLNPGIVAELERQWGVKFLPHPQPLAAPSPQAERGLGGEVSPRAERGLGGEVPWRTSPPLWERLKPLAREMRRNPPPEEDRLWQRLRNRALLGFKFRRQHSIDRFIVDFYCPEAQLVVEIEDPVHQYTREEDAVRREFLESLGMRVLRFTNDEVDNSLDTVLEKIEAALTAQRGIFTPEDIFHYIYAILYAPTYREEYAEFLKLDFPRIPFTSDYGLFQEMAALGKELVELHLLRSPLLAKPEASYPVSGTDRVDKVRYDEKKGRVFINDQQYFEDIPRGVWEYHIGGYQVLEKWLKDRKGRRLSLEDVEHYLKVITAIKQTIRLQKEIDKLYPQMEGSLISSP